MLLLNGKTAQLKFGNKGSGKCITTTNIENISSVNGHIVFQTQNNWYEFNESLTRFTGSSNTNITNLNNLKLVIVIDNHNIVINNMIIDNNLLIVVDSEHKVHYLNKEEAEIVEDPAQAVGEEAAKFIMNIIRQELRRY